MTIDMISLHKKDLKFCMDRWLANMADMKNYEKGSEGWWTCKINCEVAVAQAQEIQRLIDLQEKYDNLMDKLTNFLNTI